MLFAKIGEYEFTGTELRTLFLELNNKAVEDGRLHTAKAEFLLGLANHLDDLMADGVLSPDDANTLAYKVERLSIDEFSQFVDAAHEYGHVPEPEPAEPA